MGYTVRKSMRASIWVKESFPMTRCTAFPDKPLNGRVFFVKAEVGLKKCFCPIGSIHTVKNISLSSFDININFLIEFMAFKPPILEYCYLNYCIIIVFKKTSRLFWKIFMFLFFYKLIFYRLLKIKLTLVNKKANVSRCKGRMLPNHTYNSWADKPF